MNILLAGATGLVGSRLLPLLLAEGHRLMVVGRRPTGRVDPALTEVQTDFVRLAPLAAADVAICSLGTTMAAAGSRDAFIAIDKTAVLAFATAARAAGCRHLILVTAVGADPKSAVFYSRVKGETEDGVGALGFSRLDIVRPGLILGPRSERRPSEAFFQKLAPILSPLLPSFLDRYGGISA
ncbi:MAG: NAD(P)H-binding protein, partial [Sandaracinobacteroides sp.]